ncbi:MAG: acyl carrier protein [Planctomycetota bacterium]
MGGYRNRMAPQQRGGLPRLLLLIFFEMNINMSHSITELQKAFRKGLGLTSDVQFETLEYSVHENWDSVAHMQLVACLESEFDIALDTDDVIDMRTYNKSIDILKKYDIHFDA